ncbi:MAG: hypothetical protein WBD99_13125 [Thermodesulfobacteriota bacterium]
MCDPALIASILYPKSFPRIVIGNPYCHREGQSAAAISFLFLKELGYFDQTKEKDKRDEVRDEELKNDNSKNSGREEK